MGNAQKGRSKGSGGGKLSLPLPGPQPALSYSACHEGGVSASYLYPDSYDLEHLLVFAFPKWKTCVLIFLNFPHI